MSPAWKKINRTASDNGVSDHGGLTGLTDKDHPASAITNTPAGTISSTDVQAAINELDTEKSATGHVHTHASTTGQTTDDHHAQQHAIDGADHTGNLAGSDIIMARVAGSTYSTAQHMQDQFHSAGRITGGDITDNGDGTFSVSAGTGYIRTTDSAIGQLPMFDWAALNNQTITDGTERYIIVDYNSGSPTVSITASAPNNNTQFYLGVVVREGSVYQISPHRMNVGDHASLMVRRMWATNHIERDNKAGGLVLGETGTRNITLSAGTLWMGLESFAVSAIDTSGLGTFDRYYRDGAGGWTKQSAQTQWDNTQYDDNSGVLAALTPNWYSAQYFYLEIDGELVSLYGQNQYATLAQAEDDSPPSSIPLRLDEHGTLIGRIIFKKSAASASSVESVYSTIFSSASVSDHGDLAGLTDDDHTQYSLADGSRAFTGTGAGFRDEDDMVSNDATATASQQSIKAYADTKQAAITQNMGWLTSNVVTDKALDADATTTAELADVLATLIETLKTQGILGGLTGNARKTEDDNYRITEDGGYRITEA